MIVEVLAIIVILLSGSAVVRAMGIRGWILPFLGFVMGIAILIGVGALLIIIPWVPTWPLLMYSLTVLASYSVWLFLRLRNEDLSVKPTYLLLTIIGVILLIVLFRHVNMVNWHIDGFFYMEAGSLIADNNYHLAGGDFVERRLIATSIMHSVAHLSGEFYLRSITPLLSISTLMVLVWLFKQGVGRYINKNTLIVFSILGFLLLATNNRYLFHSFNINSHLLFAVLTLIIVGCGWLLVNSEGDRVPERALKLLQTVSIPAFIVSRPEATIVACVVLAPLMMSKHISKRYRSVLIYVLGSSIILWQGFVAGNYIYHGEDISFSVLASLALGFVVLLSAPLFNNRFVQDRFKYILWLAEIGMWVTLVALVVLDPIIFSRSMSATVENVIFGSGSWGVSLIVLIFLVFILLILRKFQNQIYIRFAITSFLPLGFLFAYMRDAPYRVGSGDSLTRMFIHIVPLAVLYIIIAIVSGDKTYIEKGSLRLTKNNSNTLETKWPNL